MFPKLNLKKFKQRTTTSSKTETEANHSKRPHGTSTSPARPFPPTSKKTPSNTTQKGDPHSTLAKSRSSADLANNGAVPTDQLPSEQPAKTFTKLLSQVRNETTAQSALRQAHRKLRRRLQEKREARAHYEFDNNTGELVLPDVEVFDNASQFVRERIKFLRQHDNLREAYDKKCEGLERGRKRMTTSQWTERQAQLEEGWTVQQQQRAARNYAEPTFDPDASIRNTVSRGNPSSSSRESRGLGLSSRGGLGVVGKVNETSLAELPLTESGPTDALAEDQLRSIANTEKDAGGITTSQQRHQLVSQNSANPTSGGASPDHTQILSGAVVPKPPAPRGYTSPSSSRAAAQQQQRTTTSSVSPPRRHPISSAMAQTARSRNGLSPTQRTSPQRSFAQTARGVSRGSRCLSSTMPTTTTSSSVAARFIGSMQMTTKAIYDRRKDLLRDQYEEAQLKRQQADEKLKRAEHNRQVALTTGPMQREWMKLIVLQKSITWLRVLSDSKAYRRRQKFIACIVAVVAGRWRGLARKTKNRAERIKANIIFKIHLPRLLERFRIKKFGPKVDLITKFLLDLKKVFQIPHAIKRFQLLVRQSQAYVRKHLLSRAMWKYAILATWEKVIEQDLALYESVVRYSTDPQTNPSHAKKLKKVVRTLENRQLQNGTDTPQLVFIPYEFRERIVCEFLKRWTHESINRMVREERKRYDDELQELIRSGGGSGPMSGPKNNSSGGGGGAPAQQGTKRIQTLNSIKARLRRSQEQQELLKNGDGGYVNVIVSGLWNQGPSSGGNYSNDDDNGGDADSLENSTNKQPHPPGASRLSAAGAKFSPQKSPLSSSLALRTGSGVKQFPSAVALKGLSPLSKGGANNNRRGTAHFGPTPPPKRKPKKKDGVKKTLQQQRKIPRPIALAAILVQDINFSKTDYRFELFATIDDVRSMIRYVNDAVFAGQRSKREELESQLLVMQDAPAAESAVSASSSTKTKPDEVGSDADSTEPQQQSKNDGSSSAQHSSRKSRRGTAAGVKFQDSASSSHRDKPPKNDGKESPALQQPPTGFARNRALSIVSDAGGDDAAIKNSSGVVGVSTSSSAFPPPTRETSEGGDDGDGDLDAVTKMLLNSDIPVALNDVTAASVFAKKKKNMSDHKKIHSSIRALLITGMITLPSATATNNTAPRHSLALSTSSGTVVDASPLVPTTNDGARSRAPSVFAPTQPTQPSASSPTVNQTVSITFDDSSTVASSQHPLGISASSSNAAGSRSGAFGTTPHQSVTFISDLATTTNTPSSGADLGQQSSSHRERSGSMGTSLIVPPSIGIDDTSAPGTPHDGPLNVSGGVAALRSSTQLANKHKHLLSRNIVNHLDTYMRVLHRAGADSSLTTNYNEFYNISTNFEKGDPAPPLFMEMPAHVHFIQQFVVDQMNMKDTHRRGSGGGAGGRSGGPDGGFGGFSLN